MATQTTRPNSPDISENTLSKTDSTLNAENTSAQVENLEDLSQASSKGEATSSNGNKNERYKKSLRLSSEAIVSKKKIIYFLSEVTLIISLLFLL